MGTRNPAAGYFAVLVLILDLQQCKCSELIADFERLGTGCVQVLRLLVAVYVGNRVLGISSQFLARYIAAEDPDGITNHLGADLVGILVDRNTTEPR